MFVRDVDQPQPMKHHWLAMKFVRQARQFQSGYLSRGGPVLLASNVHLLTQDGDVLRGDDPQFYLRRADFENLDLDVPVDKKGFTGPPPDYEHTSSVWAAT